MSKTNDSSRVLHFDCDSQECPNIRDAARWAWKCLENLATVYCEYYCDRIICSMPEGTVENLTKHRKARSEQEIKDQWEEVQREFHEALSNFPALTALAVECQACAVAESLSCFPLLVQHSPRPPVVTVKMNAVDCYPDVVFCGGDQRASFPCVIIETMITDFETETVERLRESALLALNTSKLPPMPPIELEKLKEKLIPGQNVVRQLAHLLNNTPTVVGQETPEAGTTPSITTTEYAEGKFVLERKEVEKKVCWFVNGEDKGAFFTRPNAIKAKIIEILYNQIGLGWVPHETFIYKCGWSEQAYFPSSGNPGKMQRQLTYIRNFLGVDIEFDKDEGVRFSENVVKSN